MLFKRLRFFVSSSYGLIQVNIQLMYGIWRLSRLEKPIVSIFGSARLAKKDWYFLQAHTLASRLVEENISVVTGGGPGIMEAANCGAVPHHGGKGVSIGIGVRDLGEGGANPCVQEYFELNYFFARKWLLTRFSRTFVVFPGGFGTLDELSEVLTLIQTKKIARNPIILVGKEYWEPFMVWVRNEALVHKMISKDDLLLFIVTDDIEEVFRRVRDECCPELIGVKV